VILASLKALSPILVMLATALWVLIDDLLAGPAGAEGPGSRQSARTAASGSVLALLCVGLVGANHGVPADSLHPYLRHVLVVDPMALFFQGIIVVLTLLAVLLSHRSFQEEGRHSAEYYALLLFVAVGEMLAVSSIELLTFFVAFELLSLPLYMLAAFRRYNSRSAEAGLKYFLTGALASALMLYGFSFVYGTLGTTQFAEFSHRIPAEGSHALLLGLLLVLAGMAFKVAAAPFHNWAPDVYEGAPPAVVAYMSSAPKAAMTAVLLRFFWMSLDAPGNYLFPQDWGIIFSVLAMLSMTIGNLAALNQTSVPRLLAYSGIAHIGYLLLGIASCSSQQGGKVGFAACMYYAAAYVFANLAAWGVLVVMQQNGRTLDIQGFKGLAHASPLLALVLMISLMSLAGVPPLAGFVGKFYVFRVAYDAGMPLVVLIAIVNSVISLFYYFRVLRAAYFSDAPEGPVSLTFRQRLVLQGCLLTVVVIGLWPGVAEWALRGAGVP